MIKLSHWFFMTEIFQMKETTDTLRTTFQYHVLGRKCCILIHDDVMKWKHFPRYWPFVCGIHRSSVNSPHKGQLTPSFDISLICPWINVWVKKVRWVIWEDITRTMASLLCWNLTYRLFPVVTRTKLCQVMAWCRACDKPLPEPILIVLMTHTCFIILYEKHW